MNAGKFTTTDISLHLKSITTLRERLRGTLLLPEDESFISAIRAWNLEARQHPAIVVMAACAEDIIAAVELANTLNIGVGVMSTGHGVGICCDGGLLINTSQMRGVQIDPLMQTATVEAGALWKNVIPAAYEHGLAGLAGSASHVGVVGYTLGGGLGFLARKYGLNATSVVSAEVVTAEGKLMRINAREHADLFWALKGGGGNFGIVTSLEFRLYPLTTIYGGAVFYPGEHARDVLQCYTRWTAGLPDEVTTAFAFMNLPPLPMVPEPLRGKSVVMIKGCYCGDQPEEKGPALFAPILQDLGSPVINTYSVMLVTEMDKISNDPVDPMGVLQFGCLLSEVEEATIDKLVKLAGPGSGSPLAVVELRRLGGAIQRQQQDMQLMGGGNAQYTFIALGAAATPQMAEKVNSYLTFLAAETKAYQTGENFLNFMEVNPTPERVRSAYTLADWERLVALKQLYDPNNRFRFNHNIPPQAIN